MRAFVSVTVAVLVVIGIGITFVGGLPVPSTKPLIGTALLLTGPQGTVPLAGRPWPKATWRVTASYANPISAIDSVVCPSPHMCQAVAEPFPDPRGAAQDSILLSTTNGGRSWRQDAVSGHWSIGGISCSSSTSCVTSASGSRQDVMLSTHNGGASWHARPLPTTTLPAASVDVACPTATTCHAVLRKCVASRRSRVRINERRRRELDAGVVPRKAAGRNPHLSHGQLLYRRRAGISGADSCRNEHLRHSRRR